MEMMESEAKKEFEESQEKEEDMTSISRSTVTKDEGNLARTPSWFPQKNPLLIDLILDVTLSHLPLKDLLSCRLVCQDWNRISTPKVKIKSPELIFAAIDLTLPCPNGPSGNNFFLETMRNSLSIPCSKFELRFEPSNPDLLAFQELIDVCSNEITSLHLAPLGLGYDPISDPGPDTNKATFQNWLKALKKLTKFTITDLDFGVTACSTFFEPENELNLDKLQEFHFLQFGRGGKPSSGFFDGFFKAAQNLVTISFGVKDYREEYEKVFPHPNPNHSDDSDDSSDDELERWPPWDSDVWNHEDMLDSLYVEELHAKTAFRAVLDSLRDHGKLDGIKSLTFHNLDDTNLIGLIRIGVKGLKLESFHVHGKTEGWIWPHLFCAFLKIQEESLKRLKISGLREPPGIIYLWFPHEMRGLERLDISTNGYLRMWEPICYASKFPKIRQLHVQGGHRRRDYPQNQDVRVLDAFFPEVENLVPCETLKELKMDFTLSDEEPIEEGEIIQRVSAIFPKMTIRVQVVRPEDDILENQRAKEMTLKIFGN